MSSDMRPSSNLCLRGLATWLAGIQKLCLDQDIIVARNRYLPQGLYLAALAKFQAINMS
jgi:hypothetical protein